VRHYVPFSFRCRCSSSEAPHGRHCSHHHLGARRVPTTFSTALAGFLERDGAQEQEEELGEARRTTRKRRPRKRTEYAPVDGSWVAELEAALDELEEIRASTEGGKRRRGRQATAGRRPQGAPAPVPVVRARCGNGRSSVAVAAKGLKRMCASYKTSTAGASAALSGWNQRLQAYREWALRCGSGRAPRAWTNPRPYNRDVRALPEGGGRTPNGEERAALPLPQLESLPVLGRWSGTCPSWRR
jgi:hypothetical protein